MADKRKLHSDNTAPENDRQFLDRTGASAQIRDALAKILENRPKDPISFLADYFDSFDNNHDLVTKAFQQLNLTHFSKPVFETNVRLAYETLNSKKVAKGLRGINGESFMALINAICRGIPGSITDKLLAKLQCRPWEAIQFPVFRTSVTTCYIMKDFLKESEELFKCLDLRETGRANKSLCEAVLGNLKESINQNINKNKSTSVVLNIATAFNLAPDKISTALHQASGDRSSGILTKEQFVSSAADSFLATVSKIH
ncbi:tubulin polyglutamylase complex subunit 1-like [Tubulanus polymorphus]|uniref:tubulin polyglutamylase complex subunit 1-like n=1 Tax=Tubulanus polymorphus TaxID=672921 RepID=UPI003DA2D724